ncbi:MAG: hypothetical protein ACJ77E_07660 [Gaiellaceae bacterium]
MIRVAAALAAVVAAGLLVAVAVDAGRWQHAQARRPSTLVGHVAERLLGTTDDIALRRAIAGFDTAEHTPYGFDNGANQARARVLAEGRLADVAAEADARQASQADDLLGVLAWGGVRSPVGTVDPADRAVQAFTEAARLDPSNTAASFNLEIALRALQTTGVRHGPSPSNGPRGTGHSGAGAGVPGRGY